jgi:hypothetical protein
MIYSEWRMEGEISKEIDPVFPLILNIDGKIILLILIKRKCDCMT